MNTCSQCKFWDNPCCHRFPPIIDDEWEKPVFPETKPSDWCGEFQQNLCKCTDQNRIIDAGKCTVCNLMTYSRDE